MTRFISYLASFFIVIDLAILFLGVTAGITWQMIIMFPIVTLLAWRLTKASNNRKAADNYRRRYREQVTALRTLQDEQGADKVRALRPMVRELGCPRQTSQYRVEQGYTVS